jgi:hypothetical protein
VAILVTCPNCGKSLQARDEWAGKSVRCPDCQNVVAVPAQTWAEAPEPEPPPRPVRYEDDRPPRSRYEEDDRPPARSRRYEEDDRPPRRHRDDGDYGDYGDYDDDPWRKPKPVETPRAVPILMLIGGVIAIIANGLSVVIFLAGTLIGACWPGFWYGLTQGVIALVMGIIGLSKGGQSPRWPAILQIINIINCDVFNLTFGIIELVLISNAQEK